MTDDRQEIFFELPLRLKTTTKRLLAAYDDDTLSDEAMDAEFVLFAERCEQLAKDARFLAGPDRE